MKKSFRLSFLVFVAITVLLSACAPAATPVPPTSTSVPPTVTPVPPTPTITPTSTFIPTATLAATTGKIVGRVYQSDTDRSFSEAEVSLNNATLDPKDPAYEVAKATTDANGKYVFDNVTPGKYTLAIMVWIQGTADMPCSIMIMQDTKDQQWLLVTIKNAAGRQGILATQTHVENNSWVPTVFDVAAGDNVQMDADLRCQ